MAKAKSLMFVCMAFGLLAVMSELGQEGGHGFAVAAEKTGPTDLQGVTQNWDKKLPANDPGGQ
jgi:hypothetical protein